MLLVYTTKITPRLNYTFKQFFTRILDIPVSFTSTVEEFVAHSGLKLTYAKQPLSNEIFVRSSNLLFEQGINDVEVVMSNWDDVPSFFNYRQEASVPFDIFAASFYLLSRYEEYLPHVKDQFERFPAEESLAFQHNFLNMPLVDIWAYKFRSLFLEKFPDFTFKERTFEFISTIDIDIAYKYKRKGVIRGVGGYFRDISKFNIAGLFSRISTNLGFKKDPFDTYDLIIKLQKEYNTKTIFFFSVSDYSTFDKNTSYRNSKYQSLIKSVADYCKVGLHPSYFSMKDESLLKKEKKRLDSITNIPTKRSRQHYLRLALPETYQNLVNLEFTEDYTMGYAKHYGFRASTCTPFYFYDLDYEVQTPLKIFPFAVMDGTLRDYQDLSNKRSHEVIMKLANEVKQVNGTFITLFHNETLSNRGRWRRWRKLYIDILKKLSKY